MRPMRHQPRKTKQCGAALMVMLVIMVMGVAAALVGSLSTTALKNARQEKTAAALAQAKEALIGYAISYGDTHPEDPLLPRDTAGYLPCPDTNGSAGANPEGSSETCGSEGANSMGRLPWKTLELPSAFDGQQDCLWYAVSGNYKNNPKYGGQMNWDTPAQLHVFDSNGNELQAEEVVAVIFSPGTPLSGNSDRSGTTAPTCGGNYTASAYLDNDTTHGINNADISAASFIMPHDHRDASGNITLSTNDQFVYITRQDIWNTIQTRVAREAKKCLDSYAESSNGKYPWAAPVNSATYTSTANTRFGRIPDSPSVATYTPTDPDIIDMLAYLTDLQTALDNYAANNTWTTRNALDDAGDNLNNVADDILDAGTYPANVEAVASPAKSAGSRAKHLADGDSGYTIAGVQSKIDEANTALASLSSEDADMQASWPSSCFSSATWTAWKSLVFYQVDDKYRPGGTLTACSNDCLSISGSGNTSAGSGNYRATIIAAGKMKTSSRTFATVTDYLEGANVTGKTDIPTTSSFETYRSTDASYANNNDLALCLDGKVNCQ